jgi:hypothetical protein
MSRGGKHDGLIDSRPFIFEGYFAYRSGETDEVRVSFLLEAEENQGSFRGTVSDTETTELFEKGTVSVKGFIEDDLISFVKTYPRSYFKNENGDCEVSDSSKPHAIEYIGYWDEEGQKYRGKYIVTYGEYWSDRYLGKFRAQGYEDHWEMTPSEATVLETWPWTFFPING